MQPAENQPHNQPEDNKAKATNRPKGDMKSTLRYKHMVARLKGLKPRDKGRALMQEISKGDQWRMDAALEAIKPDEWTQLDVAGIMKQAATFGRLQTTIHLAQALGFEEGAARPDYPVQAAYQIAVHHGNYKTADALAGYGAKPSYEIATLPSPVVVSVIEQDVRKMNYLIKQGADVSAMAYVAVMTKSEKALAHLVEKKGADVNYRMPGGDTVAAAAARSDNGNIKSFVAAHGGMPPAEMVSDAELKGTPFETNLDAANIELLKNTLKLPDVTPDFRGLLKAVTESAEGLGLTLANDRQIQLKLAADRAPVFIGRDGAEALDDTEAKAIVKAALASGWKAINAVGTVEQQEAIWLEARRNGVAVANFKPDADSPVRKTWEKELALRNAAKPPAPQ